METVPFLDIKAQNRSLQDELRGAFYRIMDSASFILGDGVAQFEQDFASYCGTSECVGLNNGTTALHLALAALGIGPGDEVITTPQTWISTSWAISYVGATPVFVDVDPTTFTLDAKLAERAITPNTKALLPVHLFGQAADVSAVKMLADEHGIYLIQDAAQAHGAEFDGRRVGSFGRIGCFSFYPGKNLGCFGEGGAIVTDDYDLARRIRRLRDHAQDGRHHHVEIGYNARMEGLQGAVLSVKLPKLNEWNDRRRQHAETYRQLLSGIDGLELPEAPLPEAHVWHLYVVLVRGINRNEFRSRLEQMGIATGVHYPTPVPFQPAYGHLGYRPGSFPIAEDAMSHCVSLPMYPELTAEHLERVASAVRQVATQTTTAMTR